MLQNRSALRSAHDRDGALCSRTNETRKWGVSDPGECPLSGSTGAWQPGSLTPQMPPSLLPIAASDTDTGGTERRPLLCTQASHRQLHRRLTCLAIILTRPRTGRVNIMPPTGNAAPASAFPPLFLRFRGFCGVQRRESGHPKQHQWTVPGGFRATAEPANLPVQPSAKTLLNDLTPVTGIRSGFQVATGAAPSRCPGGLRSSHDPALAEQPP